MIEGIKLKNWKTHYDSSFEFEKGTNVLVGPMGSGKSSVMDAVCFALFGTFPSLKSRRVSIEEVIMTKPYQAEEAIVELAFSYNGKGYKVERKIKKKGSTEAKIWCEGKVLAGPKPKDVNKVVEKAIEINYNLFSRAVYSEQNEIDSFLRLTPSERKTKFDELLDLQRYDIVRGNAVTASNRIKTMVKDKTVLVKEQKDSLDKDGEKELLKRIEKKEKENKELEEKGKEKALKAEKLMKEIKGLEEKEKEFRKLKEELGGKKATGTELEKGVEETKKEAGGKSLEEIKKEQERLTGKIKELEKKALDLKEKEEVERKKKTEFGKEGALSQRKVKELNEHLKEFKGLGAECPTCRQKLEVKTREQLVQETEEGIKKATAKFEEGMKKEAETNTVIEKLKKEFEKTVAEKEKAREEEIKLEQLKEAIVKLAEKEKQAEDVRKEITVLEKKFKEIDFNEKELLEKRKTAIETKAFAESAKKEIEANLQLVKEMKTGIERIEKTKKQIGEWEEKIKVLESSSEKVGFFVNSLTAAQSELREMLIATINEAMHDIWQRIYPYKDYVSAKMDVEKGSYELKAKEKGGNWVRVEGILSGGERSAAAICIRIAFSLVLTRNLSWLILDEPTHNLDSNAVETLGKMMQLHLPSIVEQVFVITHNDEMKKAASGSLYILEREKDEDAATKPVLAPIEK